MTVHAGGAVKARIATLQQQEQTEDRDEAEALADRIGRDDVREVMERQDARADAAGGEPGATNAQADASAEAESTAADANVDHGAAIPVGAQASDFAGIESPQVGDGAAAQEPSSGAEGSATSDAGATGAADAAQGAANGAPGLRAPTGTAAPSSEELAGDLDRTSEPQEPQSEAGNMQTGDLVLIDIELAEHQRWAAAEAHAGAAGSDLRAQFVAEQVGSGFVAGVASGAAMGLGIGLVTRAVPVLGPIIGGGMALHGLLTRDWAATGATIGRFGEGNDTYEVLANTLASVSAIIDIATQVLDVITGIVGVVEAVAIGVAAGAGVLAFFTFGATAGIAVAAGELAVTCEEIREAVGVVSLALTNINNELLNPCILLFRALHSFTSQADPREIEDGGRDLSAAGGAVGGALGGWLGGHAAQLGGRARPPAQDGEPTTPRPQHELPPPAGDAPDVHFTRPAGEVDVPAGAGASAHPAASEPHAPASPAAAATAPEIVSPQAAAAATAAPEHVVPPAGAGAPEHPAAGAPAGPVADAVAAATAPGAGGGGTGRGGGGAGAGPPAGGGGSPAVDPVLTGRRPEPGGMVIHEFGRPGVDSLEHLDVDATVAALDPHAPGGPTATSDTFFELPAGRDVQPQPGAASPAPTLPAHGLQDVEIRMNPDPTRIQYHENMEFAGVTHARIAEHGDVPIDGPRGATVGAPGTPHTVGSVLPDNPALVTTTPVPVRQPPSPLAGQPWPVEVRLHSANPSPALAANAPDAHSRFNPTVQVNTSNGRYLLPDGRWVPQNSPEIGPAHYPAGGRDRGPAGTGDIPGLPPGGGPGPGGGGPGPAGGGPPPGGGGPAPGAGGPAPAGGGPEASAGGGAGPQQRILVVGAERPEEFDYARQMTAMGRDVTVVNPVVSPAGEAFAAEGGNMVAGGIETLPQRPGFNVVAEDYPVPIRRMLPQAQAQATERISRLEPGGRWVVTTESDEYVNLLSYVGRTQGVTVSSHEIPMQHEATPASPYIAEGERRRFVVVLERPAAAAALDAPPSPAAPSSEPPPATTPLAGAEPPSASAPTPVTPPAPSGPTPPAAAASASTAPAGRTPAGWGARAGQLGALFLPQFFGGGGEAPTYAQQRAAHRARFTEDNQPEEGVERANPHYTAPPATPEQIVAVQNEILNLLAVRSRAEVEAEHEGERVEACEANRAPIAASVADTRGGLSAITAHEQAIARRDAANQEQQQRQQDAAGLTASYPDCAAGLAALTLPLAAWEGFTSLASHLPGDAGDRMGEMNAEARQMQESFDHMAGDMGDADGQQPDCEAGLADDAQRIASTDEQATDTRTDLQTAADGAVALREENEATCQAAQSRQDKALQRRDGLEAAAQEREQTTKSLAEQLRAWAQQHRAERAAAVAEVVRRHERAGHTTTQRPAD